MLKKKISLTILLSLFVISTIFIVPHNKINRVEKVISPTHFILSNKEEIKYNTFDTFDSKYTEHNKKLAQRLGITEEEAFILGNLGKYWADSLMKGRNVYTDKHNDLIYLKYSYLEKFKYSGFCIESGNACFKSGLEKRINDLRKTQYKVLDLDNEIIYEITDPNVKMLKNYLVLKKYHLPYKIKNKKKYKNEIKIPPYSYSSGNVKIYFSDLTTKTKPDRTCASSICKEILSNINNAKESIDIAIYGYSSTPEIEKAIKSALNRGVKIRLVYDADKKGGNIYPDTNIITSLIKNNTSDKISLEKDNIMHNKFYIFDNKILITGSANLSHTDMSGFNSNSIAVIYSHEAAEIYKKEFEQMFLGKFHNEKFSNPNRSIIMGSTELSIYFSPQDKSITNAVIPLINNAKKYIYIPTFVLTDRKASEALIRAKKRGVDVKIIIDALNASVKHTKHNELRNNGIQVKTENYAGKMHSKSIIVDDTYTIIGSMNFSYSGENKNDENLILIKNPEIAKSYKEFFLYQWNKIDEKWLKYNARAEGKDSIGSCSDGLDNNYDGFTDKDDPACR